MSQAVFTLSIFSGICVNSEAFIPLVRVTGAGQNNAIQYFLIYSNMDVTKYLHLRRLKVQD